MDSQINISKRWFAIVNPVAGKGKGLTDWPVISTLLHEAGIEVDALFTQRKHHATELAVYAVGKGYRKIIIIGGDGTIHETVHGLFLQQRVATADVLLAVIAVGTGNDWMRMYGIPNTYSDAVRSIVQGHTFLQDVGRVTYWESKVCQRRYLANVGGIAYDAAVCRGFNKLKENGYRGKWLYIWSAAREACRFRSRQARIVADGKEVFNGKLFTATIGICKYTGGGMSQTPYAVADDGLFDMTVIPSMNRVRLFSRFRTLYTNNIYNITGVNLIRAGRIVVECDHPIQVELDGEILGEADFTFEIVPRAVRAIVSKNFVKLNEYGTTQAATQKKG